MRSNLEMQNLTGNVRSRLVEFRRVRLFILRNSLNARYRSDACEVRGFVG